MLPPVADRWADPAQVAQAVAVAKVAYYSAQVLRFVAYSKEAQLAALTVLRAAAMPDVVPEVSSQPELSAQQVSELERLVAQRAREWQPRAELREVRPVPQEQAPAQQPAVPPQRVRPVSERRPGRVAVQPEWLPGSQALARPVQPGAVEPLWPLPLSLPCPPWPSLQWLLLHPRRREGACEPSRPRPPESSSSVSSFLLRRTRATGR
jgi:hypothetical protein